MKHKSQDLILLLDSDNVPDYKWDQIEFTVDNTKLSGNITFEEHTDPWFMGDCYEFPSQCALRFFNWEFKEDTSSWADPIEKQKERFELYYGYIPDQWRELTSDELNFFFNNVIKAHVTELEKKENRANKKKLEKENKLNNFVAQLTNHSIDEQFKTFVTKHKLGNDAVAELIALLNYK